MTPSFQWAQACPPPVTGLWQRVEYFLTTPAPDGVYPGNSCYPEPRLASTGHPAAQRNPTGDWQPV